MGTTLSKQNGDATASLAPEKSDAFSITQELNREQTSAPTPEVELEVPIETEETPKGEKEKTESVPKRNTQEKRRPSTLVRPPPSQVVKPIDPLTLQIEQIMEEGIGEAYQELTPVQKQQFKMKGEQTAQAIRILLQKTKVKIKKVFQLILEWLKMLPCIHRFFLMQEAKIKTDKILGLKQHR